MKKSFLSVILLITGMISISFSQGPTWGWSEKFGGTGIDQVRAMASDKAGNLYLTGYFTSDTCSFGAFTLVNTSSASDLFLLKADSSGNVLWVKSAGGTQGDNGYSLAVDEYANVYVAGVFRSGSIAFGSTMLINTDSSYADLFVAKFDSSGNVIWAIKGGGMKDDYATCITTYPGSVYVAGFFGDSSMTIGSETLTSAGFEDIFIASLDTSGGLQWAESYGGALNDEPYSVTVDAGGIYMGGYFSSPQIVLGNDTLLNNGNQDMLVMKTDLTGNVLWSKGAGGPGNDFINKIGLNNNGKLLLTGGYSDTSVTFDATVLQNNGKADYLLVQLDTSGITDWATGAGDTANDAGSSLIADEFGNVYVCGSFYAANITIGATTLINNGLLADVFIAKYDAQGNSLWAISVGGTASDIPRDLSLNNSGRMFIAGNFQSPLVIFGNDSITNSGSDDIFFARLGASAVGIDEPGTTGTLAVYPNPSTGKFYIQLPSGAETLQVYDISGALVFTREVNSAFITIELDKKGLFLLRVVAGRQIYSQKILTEE